MALDRLGYCSTHHSSDLPKIVMFPTFQPPIGPVAESNDGRVWAFHCRGCTEERSTLEDGGRQWINLRTVSIHRTVSSYILTTAREREHGMQGI